MDYLKYDATSQISLVNEISTQFPTVTFCDNNPFSTVYAEEFMQNISILYNQLDPGVLFKLAKLKASSKYLNDLDRKNFQVYIEKGCEFKADDCRGNFRW